MNLKTLLTTLAGLVLLLAFAQTDSIAQVNQGQQLYQSQQFRLGDRIIRVAEPGQISDTLNVWGDINSPGRYLVPRGTSLPQLISYAFGPQTIRSNEGGAGLVQDEGGGQCIQL
ncbi:MAG: hypothetical protein U5K69_16505 [Balneolaceae bacterium]|nr:hypothetical protein [Balneolaceae bacterium]